MYVQKGDPILGKLNYSRGGTALFYVANNN